MIFLIHECTHECTVTGFTSVLQQPLCVQSIFCVAIIEFPDVQIIKIETILMQQKTVAKRACSLVVLTSGKCHNATNILCEFYHKLSKLINYYD